MLNANGRGGRLYMHTSDVGSQSKRPTAWLVCLVVGVLVLIFGKPSEVVAA
jgi:hypothetical protein